MKRILPAFVLLLACPKSTSQAAPVPASPQLDQSQHLPTAHIDVAISDAASYGLQVELAVNDEQRERGLMFRKSLTDDAGMLFIFPSASHHTFWMKNTLIPLDMIFADENARVLGCVQNAEPLTLTGRGVPGESKYVLEVAGGWCGAHKVAPGARLVLGQAANVDVK